MDILGEYEKQRAVASAPIRPASFRPDSEYGFFIKLVMRVSGGKIENARQASIVLLSAAGVILLISIFIFFRGSSVSLPPPRDILRDTPTSGLRPGAELQQ